ncbi:hypothetical protein J437_LFUL004408 [Ladona fulva]|uniref:CCHC-type domain-containing protein n=1 Tax=Ladona fulva TaxID=123851 RepID=A0A8K0K1U9_LADFU|nr:hypothetical protein J437_LFUL004408 [Ladona fulva]
MNKRLKHPLPESELVELACGNLHPDYIDYVPTKEFSTIRELMVLGRSVEVQTARRESYKPTPNPSVMVDPEFWFERRGVRQLGSVLASSPVPAREGPSPAKCWNCDAVGHTFRNCERVLSKFGTSVEKWGGNSDLWLHGKLQCDVLSPGRGRLGHPWLRPQGLDNKIRNEFREIGKQCTEIKIGEVEIIIIRLQNNKTPGHYGICVELMKEGWNVIKVPVVKLFNACRTMGVFPNTWKIGIIKTLLKSEDKDETAAKSYRPNGLLPVLGKIFERVIVMTLETVFYGKVSRNQYGYMKGRSTEYAINKSVDIYEKKNYLWIRQKNLTEFGGRVSCIGRLYVKGVRGVMYRVITDYLKGKWVELEEGNWSIGKKVNRGCPQGSVLGPQLWKIVLDELLEMMEERHEDSIEMITYADDGAIFIGANRRREIEEKANRVTKI